MKKSIAQTVGSGIIVTAFGYAMKARPGPEVNYTLLKEVYYYAFFYFYFNYYLRDIL